MRVAPAGHRNHTLYVAAARLGELVGAGVLADYEAAQWLREAALTSGLPDREARRTILSGLNRGMSHPREVSA